MERANPYADFGGTVTGTRFIGREAELRTIASRVFGAGGFGSIAVVGLPRIGKTSLVSEAKPLSALDVASFFSRLDAEGVSLGGAERAEVLSLCGSHPYLLDAFGYYAWDHVEQGGRIGIEWIGVACGMLVRDYFQQIATVLDDGRMLSKAVQVIVGPQWDVTAEDAEALCELGVLLRDEEGVLRGFFADFRRPSAGRGAQRGYLAIVARHGTRAAGGSAATPGASVRSRLARCIGQGPTRLRKTDRVLSRKTGSGTKALRGARRIVAARVHVSRGIAPTHERRLEEAWRAVAWQ